MQAAKLTDESEEEFNGKQAILAIQIIDPSEKTDGKNSKRTIESSLGYGYQNSIHTPPKFQIYKYSQHDIPSYRGQNVFHNGDKTASKYFFQSLY